MRRAQWRDDTSDGGRLVWEHPGHVGSVVALKPLALWTVLRSPWPLLAAYLQQQPEAVRYFRLPPSQLPVAIPVAVRSIFTDPSDELQAVMNHEQGSLDAATIQECVGQMARMRIQQSRT
jgi:hypothetical protein